MSAQEGVSPAKVTCRDNAATAAFSSGIKRSANQRHVGAVHAARRVERLNLKGGDVKGDGWGINTGGAPITTAMAQDIDGDGVPEVFLGRQDGFVNVLSLEDEAATADWLPVRNTLNEFCKAYDVFVERIEGRRRLMELRSRPPSSAWTPAETACLTRALMHFDVSTVSETVQWLGELEPSPSIGMVLRNGEVRQGLESRCDVELRASVALALARHAS